MDHLTLGRTRIVRRGPADSCTSTRTARAGRAQVREAVGAGRLQAKLTVGPPADAYEREADRVADAVMRMPEPHAAGAEVQRACADCQEELHRQPVADRDPLEDEASALRRTPLPVGAAPGVLQRCGCGGACAACAGAAEEPAGKLRRSSRDDGLGGTEAPVEVHEALNAPGAPLDTSVRRFMEPRFGHDFGSVRVHTDARAAQSAAAVRARAYTVGNDVVFGAGEYQPGSAEGQRLLAHELTHVVQQGSAAEGALERQVVRRDPLEVTLTPESARAVITLGLEATRLRLSGELTQPGNLITDVTGVPLPLPRSTLNVSLGYSDECNRALQSFLVGVQQRQAAGDSVFDFSRAEWGPRLETAIRIGTLRIEPSGSATFVGDRFQALSFAIAFTPGVDESIPERCRRRQDRDPDPDVPGPPRGGGDDNEVPVRCEDIDCSRPTPADLGRYPFCCVVPPAPRPEPGAPAEPAELPPSTIYFFYDTPVLKPESNATFERVLLTLSAVPSLHAMIVGHTSLEGSERYNQRLSSRRARAARDLLVARGIDAARIRVLAMGEYAPAIREPQPEPTARALRMPGPESLRDLNRRAEILLFDPSGAIPGVPQIPRLELTRPGTAPARFGVDLPDLDLSVP